MSKTYVFDAEWLVQEDAHPVDDAEKIHCIIFKEVKTDNYHTFTEDNMGELYTFLQQRDATYIGHNILSADMNVFRNLLNIPFTVGRDSVADTPCTFIDTLILSKILNPDRKPFMHKGKSSGIHGLFAWAGRLDGFKPEVTDWVGLPLATYLQRCKADVILTEKLYYYLMENEV